jgi:RNA polymerase sigma factor (sigma-70 family)
VATLLTGDQAAGEDLVHDVFLRCRDRLEGMDDRDTYAYLRRSLVNAWRNRLRHGGVEARAIPRLIGRGSSEPTPEVDAREALWRAIERLPDRQRAVLVLRYYEDLSDAEIARLLGCTRVTVRTQAKRALEKLREVVER